MFSSAWMKQAARESCANFVAGVMILAGVITSAHSASATAPHHPVTIFGSKELHSENLSMFPKWRDALQRFQSELRACPGPTCKASQWLSFLDTVRSLAPEEQIRSVNRQMNGKPYITDPVNWHMPDYWATPLQFLRRAGDCEDYAISKYMALKELGFKVDDMRIVVLQDTNLNVPHAVLVVFLGERQLVLDNQVNNVVPAESIRHYQPFYSINEEGWWLHRS